MGGGGWLPISSCLRRRCSVSMQAAKLPRSQCPVGGESSPLRRRLRPRAAGVPKCISNRLRRAPIPRTGTRRCAPGLRVRTAPPHGRQEDHGFDIGPALPSQRISRLQESRQLLRLAVRQQERAVFRFRRAGTPDDGDRTNERSRVCMIHLPLATIPPPLMMASRLPFRGSTRRGIGTKAGRSRPRPKPWLVCPRYRGPHFCSLAVESRAKVIP